MTICGDLRSSWAWICFAYFVYAWLRRIMVTFSCQRLDAQLDSASQCVSFHGETSLGVEVIVAIRVFNRLVILHPPLIVSAPFAFYQDAYLFDRP